MCTCLRTIHKLLTVNSYLVCAIFGCSLLQLKLYLHLIFTFISNERQTPKMLQQLIEGASFYWCNTEGEAPPLNALAHSQHRTKPLLWTVFHCDASQFTKSLSHSLIHSKQLCCRAISHVFL